MVDVSGIGDKLVNNVDKIAGGLVFLTDGGVNNTIDLITAGMDGTLHMPPLKETFQDVITDPNLLSMGVMAIGTWILGEAGVPYMGKVGRAMAKAATGYAIGKGVSRIIYRSAHASEGSFASGGAFPTGGLPNASSGISAASKTPTGRAYVYPTSKVIDPNISADIDVFRNGGL